MPQRPLSPHLTAYRLEITSALSILHRLAGLVLGLGMLLLVAVLAAAAAGPECFQAVENCLGSWAGLVALFGVTLAFYYHLANGIRHLAWDAGFGFELPAVTASGWVVVAATVTLTLVTWGLAWMS